MDRALDPRLWVRISAPAGIVHDWGETLDQGTEPPTAPRAPQCRLPTAPSVCALGWAKCREHISLLVILCIIVYVTNKKLLILLSICFPTMEVKICSVSHFPQNVFLCVQLNKDIHTGLELLEGEWMMTDFHFWVNYPFKQCVSNQFL